MPAYSSMRSNWSRSTDAPLTASVLVAESSPSFTFVSCTPSVSAASRAAERHFVVLVES